MRALLDVNVLLAMMDEDHVHHDRARSWWALDGGSGWASCPLTQNAYVRVTSQQGYPNPQPIHAALSRLMRQVGEPNHEFWPDSIAITDPAVFDHGYVLGPGQITDVYLLGLAVKHGGRLVTFDRGLPLNAVRGADARHVVVL